MRIDLQYVPVNFDAGIITFQQHCLVKTHFANRFVATPSLIVGVQSSMCMSGNRSLPENAPYLGPSLTNSQSPLIENANTTPPPLKTLCVYINCLQY